MNDEQQILKLFEDGDRALMSADVQELQRTYAEDSFQYDAPLPRRRANYSPRRPYGWPTGHWPLTTGH